MLGYLKRPEATAATMTPDGFLRTGDLVSVDAEGNVFVCDRLKELIKVKGMQARSSAPFSCDAGGSAVHASITHIKQHTHPPSHWPTARRPVDSRWRRRRWRACCSSTTQ